MALRTPDGNLRATIRSAVMAATVVMLIPMPGQAIPPAGADAPEAARVVQHVAERTLDILHDANLDTAGRQEHLEHVLHASLDLHALAEFTLGRHRGALTPAQRTCFRVRFGSYVVQTYAHRISRRALASIDIIAARQVTPSTAAVSTRAVKADGGAIVWTWRLLSRAGRYRIVDLQMAGISMAVNYRSEIGATLSREGFDAVLRALQNHLTQGTTMHADRDVLPRFMGNIASADDSGHFAPREH